MVLVHVHSIRSSNHQRAQRALSIHTAAGSALIVSIHWCTSKMVAVCVCGVNSLRIPMMSLRQGIHVVGPLVGRSSNGAVDRRRFSFSSFGGRHAFPFTVWTPHDVNDDTRNTNRRIASILQHKVRHYLYTHLHFKLVFTIHF